MGQFSKLAIDEAKDKKKILKKELQEKSRDELSKVMIGRSTKLVRWKCNLFFFFIGCSGAGSEGDLDFTEG